VSKKFSPWTEKGTAEFFADYDQWEENNKSSAKKKKSSVDNKEDKTPSVVSDRELTASERNELKNDREPHRLGRR